ncbi:MAG: class I SAM-dependent methyltransferase [Chloroflexota bacterium]|nr:class I SAM-dependent methyltransferase [Chloroflexota bacterium]
MGPDKPQATNRRLHTSNMEGRDYDAPYRAKELAGENVHGEADFVEAYRPRSVLDAGCGTGRVAIELARRGISVVGVDIDPNLLASARNKAPHLEWHLADISIVQLGRRFDAIVMAGNVMIFLAPGSEGAVLKNMAAHLGTGGVLITGFHLSMGYLELDRYDPLAEEAGLVLGERYSTWDRAPWRGSDTYAVSVHRLAVPSTEC